MTTAEQTYSPYATDAEYFGAQPMLRRLFVIDYGCPLCGKEHQAETYVAHTTASLDDLHAHGQACLRQEHVAVPLLSQHLFLLHNDLGDYARLRDQAEESGPQGNLRIIAVTMTGESELSCDQCARRFDSFGALNEHIGLDPHTLARTGPPACEADF